MRALGEASSRAGNPHLKLIAGAGRERRYHAEAIPSYERSPPLDRAVAHKAKSIDREGGGARTETKEFAFGRTRNHGPQALASAGQADTGAARQLVVEAGVAEVDAEEWLGELGGKPRPVDGERLAAGEPEALEVEQRGPLGQVELARRLRPDPKLKGPDDAPLLQPGLLDRVVKTVKSAEGLGDLDLRGETRATTTAGDDGAVGPQSAQCIPHGVAAHAVALDEGSLTWEIAAELARVDATAQVVAQLCPERDGARSIEHLDGGAWKCGHGRLARGRMRRGQDL